MSEESKKKSKVGKGPNLLKFHKAWLGKEKSKAVNRVKNVSKKPGSKAKMTVKPKAEKHGKVKKFPKNKLKVIPKLNRMQTKGRQGKKKLPDEPIKQLGMNYRNLNTKKPKLKSTAWTTIKSHFTFAPPKAEPDSNWSTPAWKMPVATKVTNALPKANPVKAKKASNKPRQELKNRFQQVHLSNHILS